MHTSIHIDYSFNATRGKYTAKIDWVNPAGFSERTIYRYSHDQKKLELIVNKIKRKHEQQAGIDAEMVS